MGWRAGLGDDAVRERAAAGLREYGEAGPVRDVQPGAGAGFPAAGWGAVDGAGGRAEPDGPAGAAAGWVGDWRGSAAVHRAAGGLCGVEPGVLKDKPTMSATTHRINAR